jgi:hypothetical protein
MPLPSVGPIQILEEEARPTDLDLSDRLIIEGRNGFAGVVDQAEVDALGDTIPVAGGSERRGSPCS